MIQRKILRLGQLKLDYLGLKVANDIEENPEAWLVKTRLFRVESKATITAITVTQKSLKLDYLGLKVLSLVIAMALTPPYS